MTLSQFIAEQINASVTQVDAAIALLDDGATVPFIARYRKEVTGGLDDTQLRTLEEKLVYGRELNQRRQVILDSINEQGKLSEELRAAIAAADSKTRLEDLYAPYKKKRRTKAQIAREAGLEALLDQILADPSLEPEQIAVEFLNAEAGFADVASALEGAAQIFYERCQDSADLVGALRDRLAEAGFICSSVVQEKEAEAQKFSDYFDYREALSKVPSHRALALFRGRAEGFLRLRLHVNGQDDLPDRSVKGVCEREIASAFLITEQGRSGDPWLSKVVRNAWRLKLAISIETDLFARLRERAEEAAIDVFGHNLRDLLLAAPAGSRVTMGLDPGLRTGVKTVVVDATGKLLETATIFPHPPKKQWDQSIQVLAELAKNHGVELIGIGNGTASRETDKLVKTLIQRHRELKLTGIVVSEAGASVYSASELAANELTGVDVSMRGAVSIARRLQDPLAELVKIDPRSIGVGQYQHDVNQSRLARKLDAVVEDCVNAVGIDLNTASVSLLARVAGLNATLADNVVAYREREGRFSNREQLKKVTRLGPKAFEQCAGFLRIRDGENPLDASAVHPESYSLVEHILRKTGRLASGSVDLVRDSIRAVIGDGAFFSALKPVEFAIEGFGEPTVRDILAEMAKPGRDPRGEFKTATFNDSVQTLEDLKPGMILEGVVTNVANFGAFVDIGVHQDGLVHVSALADRFVKDPREVVRAGQVVKVKVVNVDRERRRIGLSMRLSERVENDEPVAGAETRRERAQRSKKPSRDRSAKPAKTTALSEAFRAAKR